VGSADGRALAVYGTLAPGEPNHWIVSRLRGEWIDGTVNGYVFEIGWGPAEGYLGFVPDDKARVEVKVLVSDDLDRHWHEIDDFEGPGYERVTTTVDLADGTQRFANIYVALTDI
jgi:gamma-glutamylcyclotransferase (GGCT)/AIG2-like uncharacterized protein YtfP